MSFVELFHLIASNSFLQLTLLIGIIASIASGIIGSYVVVKRIAFISGSISHSVLGGMGLCLWLQRTQGMEWITPMQGALVAAIISALIIGWIHLRYRQREDSVIAAIWAVGMAVGIIFISQTPGYNVELMSFLLGNILWVSPADVMTIGILDVVVVLAVAFLHNRFLLICFDEEQAHLQGVPVKALYLLLLTLVAISVVVLIQVVGIVLVMTMLTIPPTIASIFSRRLSTMMLLAVALGMLFSCFGTLISVYLDWPVGATIALLAGAAYLCSLCIRQRV
jgi:zinc transport system permease protein